MTVLSHNDERRIIAVWGGQGHAIFPTEFDSPASLTRTPSECSNGHKRECVCYSGETATGRFDHKSLVRSIRI